MWIALALAAIAGSADSITTVQARASYPDFFRIRFDSSGSVWYVSATVDSLPPAHPLAPFVRERRQYLAYIAGHVLERVRGVRLESASVRDSLRTAFYRELRDDSAYSRAILAPLAGYLSAHGSGLAGFAVPAPAAIPIDRATAVAARFYNPDVILPDGRIGVHICTARNGLFASLGQRDVALEALAFAAVWADIEKPDSTAVAGAAFSAALKHVRELPKDGTDAERVARAQQLMWQELGTSTAVQRLMFDASRRWTGLPFVIVETR